MSGSHGAFATGVASQQGTLTLPDTWFRPPFWDLLMLQLLRPNSSNLPCFYSTFHLEYPLVLSRFCFMPFALRFILCSLNGLHKSTKFRITHCIYAIRTLFKHFPQLLCFFGLKQGSLHVYKHVCVVLVAETLTEAARILSYFSCDVSDFLFIFLQVFSKIIINDIQLEYY